MREELIPEVRVNKNGVPVTKHVRATPAHKDISVGLVPPPIGSTNDISSQAKQMAKVIQDHDTTCSHMLHHAIENSREKLSGRDIEKMLVTLNIDTLDRLKWRIHEMTNVSPIQRAIRSCINDRDFALLNNMAVLLDEVPKHRKADSQAIIAGINAHRGGDVIDYGDASEDELERPKALIKAVIGLNSIYVKRDTFGKNPMIYLESEYLSEYVENNPDKVPQVVEILNERLLPVERRSGVEYLSEVVDNEQPSLSSGIL